MRTVAVVQARMGSTRLPGKVMLPLGGGTVLEQVVRRARAAVAVDELVIATTVLPEDDEIVQAGDRACVRVMRGSVHDVLERYRTAARAAAADHVVRITSDCPCVDADLIDRVVARHLEAGADYTSNIHPRTFPRGLDLEVFTAAALEAAAAGSDDSSHREHVTPFLWTQPDRFHLESVTAGEGERNPDLRVTLDEGEDYTLLLAIFDLLGEDFGVAELVAAAREHPWLARINAAVRQKSDVRAAGSRSA